MKYFFIVICTCVCLGCEKSFCRQRMEILPGLVWEYYSLKYSRLVWDKYGVVAEGEIFIGFRDYDIVVTDCTTHMCKYIDVENNSIVVNQNILGSSHQHSVMDASSAMGIFTSEPHKLYLKEMSDLLSRIKSRKQRNPKKD